MSIGVESESPIRRSSGDKSFDGTLPRVIALSERCGTLETGATHGKNVFRMRFSLTGDCGYAKTGLNLSSFKGRPASARDSGNAVIPGRQPGNELRTFHIGG
jgi:hypothetical protein